MKTLTTQILNSQRKFVEYDITKEICDTFFGLRTFVHVAVAGRKVGYMAFSLEKKNIFIHKMINFSIQTDNPLKHIGLLLVEYAFKVSLKKGKNGRIELTALDKSPAAFFRLGFRKKNIGSKKNDHLISELNDQFEIS